MKLKKTILLNILLLTFVFVTFHSALHNKFDHHHDSSCSVYVLEQMFVGADFVEPFSIFLLFIPFIFISYNRTRLSVEVQKHFSTRAPPAL